jgi:hypothetical protein
MVCYTFIALIAEFFARTALLILHSVAWTSTPHCRHLHYLEEEG